MNDTLSEYMRLFDRCEEMRPEDDGWRLSSHNDGTPAWVTPLHSYEWDENAVGDCEALALCFRAVCEWWADEENKAETLEQVQAMERAILCVSDLALIAAANSILDAHQNTRAAAEMEEQNG